MLANFGEIAIARILMAAAGSAVAGLVIAWVVVAWLFHDYQRLMPATWRPEGPRGYFLSSCVTLASGFAFALLFAMTGTTLTARTGNWLLGGLLFGLACFVALPAPVILSQAIFVNLHRGFVAGLLLNSLLFCLVSGVICSLLIM
jgi:hypothetical protein